MSHETPNHFIKRLDYDFKPVKVDDIGNLLKASFTTFLSNIKIIAKIVLSIFLPLEIFKNYLFYSLGFQDDLDMLIRADMMLDAFFGSLTTPAIIFALMTVFQTGSAPSVKESFRWGRRQWARVFGNRWLAGTATIFGLVLLIVPGIIFATWFVFTDAIVSIEGDDQRHVLRRSRELTKGHRWMLCFSGLILFVLMCVIGFCSGMALSFFDNWVISTFLDCFLDVVFEGYIVMFLMAYLCLASSERMAGS